MQSSHLSLSLCHGSLTGVLQPEGGTTAARLSGGLERAAVRVMGSLLTECEVDKVDRPSVEGIWCENKPGSLQQRCVSPGSVEGLRALCINTGELSAF